MVTEHTPRMTRIIVAGSMRSQGMYVFLGQWNGSVSSKRIMIIAVSMIAG